MNYSDLLANLDKLHTTPLGVERVRRNLGLGAEDIVAWCKQQIGSADSMARSGKNWYVSVNGCVITINANSFTIITAHREKGL